MASSQVWRHSAGLFITPDQPGLSAQEDDGQTAGASSSRFFTLPVTTSSMLCRCFIALSLLHRCLIIASSLVRQCFIAVSSLLRWPSLLFQRRSSAAASLLHRCFTSSLLRRCKSKTPGRCQKHLATPGGHTDQRASRRP